MLKNLKGSKRKSLPEREILISGNPLMNLSLRLTLMGPMTPSTQDLGRGDGVCQALRLGIRMGIECVIIEGDSLTTIQKAN
ncbi:hypothetical protein Golob_003587 [Gossypium lobatum]|uniref:RNase H type-1 domain-containing protein n=1 Tax=Gossypium lobatum TaxID=34289 RepID=A0A7J8MYT7_9ROSI|nr:hypothetical protein [Gossypium lobatum]